MADNATIGLVGLGAMGFPIGRRFLAAGRSLVIVPHNNQAPARDLASLGARIVESPGALRELCDVVVLSVPDVPQVEEVLFGSGGLLSSSRTEGRLTLLIDMSTINPTAARSHHSRLVEAGIGALDAPVSGGPARAADGSLTIMVGGEPDHYERARNVLELVGKQIVHVGGPGSGQAVKLVNQLMISVIMIVNAEALTLGVKAGVPLQTLLDVIGTASGANYLLREWMPRTVFAGDMSGGFALDLLQKDLNAALNWAKEEGVPTFGGSLAQQLYRLEQARGAGRLDYSTIANIYEKAAGVSLRLHGAGEE
jgi:3-hydroxyisobutyrate dehydrogenase-like beta-hydroxyacid dehydrogenase